MINMTGASLLCKIAILQDLTPVCASVVRPLELSTKQLNTAGVVLDTADTFS